MAWVHTAPGSRLTMVKNPPRWKLTVPFCVLGWPPLASAGLCWKGHGGFFGFEVPGVGPGRTAHRIRLKPGLRALALDPRAQEVGADGGELLGRGGIRPER